MGRVQLQRQTHSSMSGDRGISGHPTANLFNMRCKYGHPLVHYHPYNDDCRGSRGPRHSFRMALSPVLLCPLVRPACNQGRLVCMEHALQTISRQLDSLQGGYEL